MLLVWRNYLPKHTDSVRQPMPDGDSGLIPGVEGKGVVGEDWGKNLDGEGTEKGECGRTRRRRLLAWLLELEHWNSHPHV